MRVIKGVILFCFLSVGISACFNAPEFKIEPEITFNKIQFLEVPGGGTADSLILYLNFKDGDGDLGYGEDELDVPYNASFYFLYDGLGDTTKVATTQYTDPNTNIPYILLRTGGLPPGKLVTNRTRNEPNYGYLPLYDNTHPCLNYADDEVLIHSSNVDASYNITDTLHGGGETFYVIQGEPLLYKSNPNHNNIDVRFWVFENGNFVEFNWLEKYCISFNARFPVLTSKEGPLEGTIRYAMPSTGFLSNFSIKTLKLSIKVRDRALHESEEIYTPQFTLDGIRVD